MADKSSHEVTILLRAWCDGDETALDKLTPLVEAELHRLAHRYLARERPGHVLQTTALVNEAYLRLVDWKNVRWQDRAHFFGVSARLMRYILVQYARNRNQQKRGGRMRHVSLEEAATVTSSGDLDFCALDDALRDLEKYDARKCRIVELRFFGGLSVEETAEVLKISAITVMREWKKAKAWLYDALAKTT